MQRLEHPRAEEADARAGLGVGDVAERSPRGEDAAEGGAAQPDEVGQSRPPVGGERRGDGRHLDEGGGALLHPGPARHRARQQRQPLPGGPADRLGQQPGRLEPDRAAEEGELTGHDGDAAAAQQPLADDDGLAGPGLLPRRGELGAVVLGRSSRLCRAAPGHEAALVEDGPQHLLRGRSHGRSCPRAASQARTSSPSPPSTGGARCPPGVVSAPSAGSKKRSGGPGSVSVPRVACSTSTSRPCDAVCGSA